METKKTIRPVLDFHKRAFDNAFNALSSLQDETEMLFFRFLEKSNWMTPDGKKIIGDMCEVYRKGRIDFKTITDEHYRKTSKWLAPAETQQ